MWPVSLWARRYQIHIVALIAVMEVLAWTVLESPVSVPGRDNVVEWMLLPIVPALVAMYAPTVLHTSYEPSEIVSALPVQMRRQHASATILAMVVAAPFIALGNSESALIGVRNGLLLTGLSFLATLCLARQAAWVPAFVFPVACWLLGTPTPGNSPASWALLIRPWADRWIVVLAALTCGAAVVTYIAREQPFRSIASNDSL